MSLLAFAAARASLSRTVPLLRPPPGWLHYYHEIGVLEPACVDPGTGYRRYSRQQVARARLIVRLRSVEVPVAGNEVEI